MSDQITVKKWSYPFRAVGEPTKEVTDPQVYFDALAKAANGFYPMGSNGLWHGGVHFDEHTAKLLDQSSVRCIADGEVVAYRIDDPYPRTIYEEGSEGAQYSTGFVLVRHRLELPLAPKGSDSSAGAETATAAEPECLTFFSLYMHLLDWPGYTANPTLERPAFWGEGCYTVKADAPNQVLGLNVREHHKVASTDERYAQYQNKLATLPRGTRIETGEAAPSPYQGWRKLVRATPSVKGLADNTGWVYVPEAKKLAEHEYLIAEDLSRDVPAVETRGLHVRAAASSGSDVLAVLPRGTQVRVSDEGATGGYVKLLEACESAVPPLSADASGKVPGFVWLDSLEPTCEPNESAMDAVYVLPQPQRIDAGALIGHLGMYQDYGQAAPSPRLHLEVFSCEDVPAFIAKSRARAATLPESDKTLIKVHKGSSILQPAGADTQIPVGCDVRLCSDSPTEGRWAKVQKYAVCNAEKATELSGFSSATLSYALNGAQKDVLAARMGIAVSDMPDSVDFLKVAFESADGGSPLAYTPGVSVPSTHRWRKVGARIGQPLWVERSKLNAEGQRISTSDALAAWKQFPLQSASDGTKSGYDRILPASSWNGLPHERKAIDQENVRWWYVTVGDEHGEDVSGWVPEKDLIVTRHSPWEWPGFSTLQDGFTLEAHLARTLAATGGISDEENDNYSALIDATERGPVLSKLYKIIDQRDETGRRDGRLSPAELKAALAKPWLAQQLSSMITEYESEWFWRKNKWDELDPLLAEEPGKPNSIWEIEKQRIENLSWWEELAEQHVSSVDGKAWHFQALGLITSLSTSGDENDLKWLKVPYGQLTFDVEGNDIVDSIHFSRVVHWPMGPSGVTIGRGYDLGQRPSPEIDLTDAGVPEPLFSWLLGAKGLKGLAAKSYLDGASDEIKKFQITRKQQYELFIPVYEFMRSEIIRISSSPANVENYGSLGWDGLNNKIQDVAVDLIYRGDYTPDTRKLVQQHIVDNDLSALRKTMADRSKWPRVPSDRFNRRADYWR